jgi:hypothetical protein
MADGVGKLGETRTTTRWARGELAWLESTALARGVKVGTLVRQLVQAAMAADAAGAAAVVSTASARRVPVAAASSSPSGAAASPRGGVRLDVVVARRLDGGRGPIPPARVAAARRLILAGRVRVAGVVQREAGELVPGAVAGLVEVV